MVTSPSQQEVRLARELRELREAAWPGADLTQAKLAKAFSEESPVAAPTLSSWESLANPKLPTEQRLTAYARFFATKRSLEPEPHLIALEDLTPSEHSRYEELKTRLVQLRTPGSSLSADVAERNTWNFLGSGPATVICPEAPPGANGPLASPSNPDYTKLHRYNDLDALIELFGHLRAQNPEMGIFHRLANEIQADDLSSHLIVLGGVGWNEVTRRLMSAVGQMPISQSEEPGAGEVFAVADPAMKPFRPQFEDLGDGPQLIEDVALLARLPNPFNSSRTLTICNGIHSRGVLGAVRALTDARVRDANENYLATRFPDGRFGLLLRVPVVHGEALTPDLCNPDVRLYEWPPIESRR